MAAWSWRSSSSRQVFARLCSPVDVARRLQDERAGWSSVTTVRAGSTVLWQAGARPEARLPGGGRLRQPSRCSAASRRLTTAARHRNGESMALLPTSAAKSGSAFGVSAPLARRAARAGPVLAGVKGAGQFLGRRQARTVASCSSLAGSIPNC